MNTNKNTVRFVGVLFLTAMGASLVGGGLVESALSTPDKLAAAFENKTQVMVGVLLELVNSIAVIGIGVLLFPILKQHNEKMALGYLGFRLVEAAFCGLIVLNPLSLMALSQEYVLSGISGTADLQIASAFALSERASVSGLLIPVFFSLGALVFYSSLFRSKLLPRFISVWGWAGASLIFIGNLWSQFTVLPAEAALIFGLPIILNEIFLGFWLIVRGFKPAVIALEPARQLLLES